MYEVQFYMNFSCQNKNKTAIHQIAISAEQGFFSVAFSNYRPANWSGLVNGYQTSDHKVIIQCNRRGLCRLLTEGKRQDYSYIDYVDH